MSSVRGPGGLDSLLTPEGQTALLAFRGQDLERSSAAIWACHQLTQGLRFVADSYRNQNLAGAESQVKFELDAETGLIQVHVKDSHTGDFSLKLSEQEVERVLKALEETDDNDSSTSSFILGD